MKTLAPGTTTTSLALAVVCGAASALAAIPPIPNRDFREGDQAPAAWKLVGNGRWVDREVLEVTGTGSDSSYWRCDYRFEPARLYRFRVRARRLSGSGIAVTGPVFANRDVYRLSKDWQWAESLFRVPDRLFETYLRLGQWHATGAIQFDSVALTPVLAVHRRIGPLVLGEGESIHEGEYLFSANFDHRGGNYHRPLFWADAWFNSNRWLFGRGTRIVYRFALPGCRFVRGDVDLSVNYHSRGRCRLEVSR
ncbi:MAG TPA: hypothetical protein EYP14_01520, partial [Planctomycetaceae bacterium]|nr:hypothetical protein [Planctomycetaceae bacterium]